MQEVTPSSILTATLTGVVWFTSALVKCTGDMLSWCGTQGLQLVEEQPPKTDK